MPPSAIEVLNTLRVYDPVTDTWITGFWNIFTQEGENLSKPISISSIGNNVIIPGTSGKKILITTLLFTVGGAVGIILYNGSTALSGQMSFGDTGEPRGMVSNFYNNYLELSNGSDFIINLSLAVQVSGLVVYKLK